MTGSKECPPVHFCKTGKTSEAGDPGSTPALDTTLASQVMRWSIVSFVMEGKRTYNQLRKAVHHLQKDLESFGGPE